MFLLDDVVAGAIKYRSFKGKSISSAIRFQCNNTLRIWLGLFTGSLRQVLSRFTWEIIQTIAGLIVAHVANLIFPVTNVAPYHGATVLEAAGVKGSICFGTYILLYPGRVIDGEVCKHEYGHTLQSRISGPLYFLKYGISSLLANATSWVEKDANTRVAQFFGPDADIVRSGNWFFAEEIINPKWWEYTLFFLGIGIILVPILNYREGR
jgi:hypothetical protein